MAKSKTNILPYVLGAAVVAGIVYAVSKSPASLIVGTGSINGWYTATGYIREDGEDRKHYTATVIRNRKGNFLTFKTRR